MSFYIYETTTETKGEVEMEKTETNAERLKQIMDKSIGLTDDTGCFADIVQLDVDDYAYLIEHAIHNDVTIVKEKKGIPTVIEYNGDRYIYDSPTAYKGGANRAEASKT